MGTRSNQFHKAFTPRIPLPSFEKGEKRALNTESLHSRPEGDEVEYQPCNVNRREDICQNSDAERHSKPLHRTCPKLVEKHSGDQSGQVRVDDRDEGAMIALIDGSPDRLPPPQLFLDSLMDQNVGIDSHSDRQDKTRDARESEGSPENGQGS